MKERQTFLIGCIIWMMGVCAAGTAPVVSNVTASQRADASKLVDIYYDLADDDGDLCTVWVIISDDGGATWTIPAKTFTGDWGKDIGPGQQKQIIWDAGRDIPGKSGLLFKARVFADDGMGSYPMVIVPASEFNPAGDNNWIYVPTMMMDQFEVTNAQYAEFLNETTEDQTGKYYDSQMEIIQTGTTGSYTYSAKTEKENYPVRFVSFNDATAYCNWKRSRTGLNYLIPTLNMWYKAAFWNPETRKMSVYPFQSETISCSQCNYQECNVGKTTPVGFFNGINPGTVRAASYYGCFDMGGNVLEITSSPSGRYDYVVIRGGSFISNSSTIKYPCTDGGSNDTPREGRQYWMGFRLSVILN